MASTSGFGSLSSREPGLNPNILEMGRGKNENHTVAEWGDGTVASNWLHLVRNLDDSHSKRVSQLPPVFGSILGGGSFLQGLPEKELAASASWTGAAQNEFATRLPMDMKSAEPEI